MFDSLDVAIPTNYADLTKNALDESTVRWHLAEVRIAYDAAPAHDRALRCERKKVIEHG
jgi:hypothetical protein